RLRTMLSKTTVPAGASGNISFTVSIGVTNCLQASDSLDHMLKRADNALYAAKAAGRIACVMSSGAKLSRTGQPGHSHSMVAGGFPETS
ncbi:MAG: diguanylate cyclase, partial [Betaproteobacteria bacterium]|nr:diguanylate cyclase [Betaproteobacteria bacterium]